MKCIKCKKFHRKNLWICPDCNKEINGGIVFITGISGSGVDRHLKEVLEKAKLHDHPVVRFDVGEQMHQRALEDDPDVKWDKILEADEIALRHLRAHAFQKLAYEVKLNPNKLFIVDLHVCFRWSAFLTRGIEPYVLEGFKDRVRFFVNIIEDLNNVQKRLKKTSWGKKAILELLFWRDEELFITQIFSDICGRVPCYAVAYSEPPETIEKLIWHNDVKKVYLSFPITNILKDKVARKEIENFRDKIREFLVVFDPYACKDYDTTYTISEMKKLRKEVGETTKNRDFRFIDQSDAIVVYFPRVVPSKGVDSEMDHAKKTGKPIFLYSPGDLGGGPFAVPPSHFRNDPLEFYELLKKELK